MTNKKHTYWLYQYQLGEKYLAPLLRQWGLVLEELQVLDIGCAEGGIVCALVNEGVRAFGIEVLPSRLVYAKKFASVEHLQNIHFIAGDFFHLPIGLNAIKPQLIMLRDVFEHLVDKQIAVEKIKQMMAPGSKLFITFPPFYAPFGGHQQMLQSFLRYFPYFHILPRPFWHVAKWWIKHFDSNPQFIAEMERLRNHKTTIQGFKKLVENHGLRISKELFYVSRPSYHLRYGWPVIKAGFFGRIPILRELVISGAFFLLERNGSK